MFKKYKMDELESLNILHGGYGVEEARKILERRNIPYRFEGPRDYDGPATLITPGGRFVGLELISAVFG